MCVNTRYVSPQASLSVNCADIEVSKPYKLRTPKGASVNHRYTGKKFYVDSEETFTVSVRARNNEALLSEPTTLTVTSSLLRMSVTLVPLVASDAVKLLLYPNSWYKQ